MQPNDGTNQSYEPISPNVGAPTPMEPAPKHRSPFMILGIVLAVLIVVGVGAALLSKKSPNNSGNNNSANSKFDKDESAQLSLLASKGAKLTAADVSQFNAEDLFFGAFRNAAEQQNVTTTVNFYQTSNLNDPHDTSKLSYHQTGYNYANKVYAYQDSTYYPASQDLELDRCVDGKAYAYSSLFPDEGWKTSDSNDSTNCVVTQNPFLNDGLNAGGLTTAQANAFVNALRGYSGLFSNAKASFVSFQNKPYIRLDITLNQIQDTSSSTTMGVGFFDKAFSATGLDSTKLPYDTGAAMASGGHIAYFVDPTTGLPAYSQFAFTPPTTNGKWDNNRVVYSFSPVAAPTLDTKNIAPITMDWQSVTF